MPRRNRLPRLSSAVLVALGLVLVVGCASPAAPTDRGELIPPGSPPPSSGPAARPSTGTHDDGTSEPAPGAGTAHHWSPTVAKRPLPQIADLPEVIATIDGEPIPRETFVAAYRQVFPAFVDDAAAHSGPLDQAVWRTEVLDAMIEQRLLVRDARDRGHRASALDVAQWLRDAAEARNLDSIQDLFVYHRAFGFSDAQVRSFAADAVLIRMLVDRDLPTPDPTPEQIEVLYHSLGYDHAEPGAEIPTLAEIAPELGVQLRSRHRTEAREAHAGALAERAQIERFLPAPIAPAFEQPGAQERSESGPGELEAGESADDGGSDGAQVEPSPPGRASRDDDGAGADGESSREGAETRGENPADDGADRGGADRGGADRGGANEGDADQDSETHGGSDPDGGGAGGDDSDPDDSGSARERSGEPSSSTRPVAPSEEPSP